jgi:hypothetical protein
VCFGESSTREIDFPSQRHHRSNRCASTFHKEKVMNKNELLALESLVTACERAFTGPETETLEDDADDVSIPPSGITFGQIRKARAAIEALTPGANMDMLSPRPWSIEAIMAGYYINGYRISDADGNPVARTTAQDEGTDEANATFIVDMASQATQAPQWPVAWQLRVFHPTDYPDWSGWQSADEDEYEKARTTGKYYEYDTVEVRALGVIGQAPASGGDAMERARRVNAIWSPAVGMAKMALIQGDPDKALAALNKASDDVDAAHGAKEET